MISLFFPRHRRFGGALLLVATAAVASLAGAQGASGGTPVLATPETHGTAHPLEQHDLDAWLDGYVPFALRRGDSRIEPFVATLGVLGAVVFPLGLLSSAWKLWQVMRPRSNSGIRSKLWRVLLMASFGVILWGATVFQLIGARSGF